MSSSQTYTTSITIIKSSHPVDRIEYSHSGNTPKHARMHTHPHMHTHIGWCYRDRQTDTQTHTLHVVSATETDRQTDRQTNRQTHTLHVVSTTETFESWRVVPLSALASHPSIRPSACASLQPDGRPSDILCGPLARPKFSQVPGDHISPVQLGRERVCDWGRVRPEGLWWVRGSRVPGEAETNNIPNKSAAKH